MRFGFKVVLIGFLFVVLTEGYAQKIEKIVLEKSKDIDRADLYFIPTSEKLKGVLVLCPGCNGNGEGFLKQPQWQRFAKQNQLGLVGLSFASPVKKLQANLGYYYADQGSGKLLVDGLDQAFGNDLPIMLFGFSGGAHFTSRFMEWKPERVKAWCAYSAEWWSDPKSSKAMPPGIVACGDYDGSRYGASQMFFNKGRSLGKPWTWVSLSKIDHEWHPQLEEFVRIYFAAVLQSPQKAPVWCDVETKRALDLKAVDLQPTLAAWLPDSSVAGSWRSLHQP